MLALPREDLLLQGSVLLVQLSVLRRALLQRLGELDDLVLQLIRDLLELVGRLRLGLESTQLSHGELSSPLGLQKGDLSNLRFGPLTNNPMSS